MALDVEIDYTTYLQQTSKVFSRGILDYGLISGESGPIAYPAGFVYVFEIIQRVTGGDIFKSQILFAAIYLSTLWIVLSIYKKTKTPYWAFILSTLSRRLHSIYVLRLFNDCLVMLFLYSSILASITHRWRRGTILFSLALSIKMNVLLFYPAMFLIQRARIGLKRTIGNGIIIVLTQLLLGAPFLLKNPKNYVKLAFNFARRFEWTWTVNWRFLGETTFTKLQSSSWLLVLHATLTIIWMAYRRNHVKTASQMCRLFFESNLIGIILSKSLHYQFFSWYSMSIPFLLHHIHPVFATVIYFGIERCWNVYPSTFVSSLSLLALNLLLLIASLRERSLSSGKTAKIN